MPESASSRIPRLLYACCLLSGAAALTYEVVWNRDLLAVFGSTTYATAAVLAAFLGGMALGAALVAGAAGRIRAPLRLYAAVELTVAGYALLFGRLLEALAAPYGRLWEGLGAAPGALLSGPLVVGGPLLVVPTLALGATLPLLGAALGRSGVEGAGAGACGAGRLYGFNTLGAVAGALGAGFLLLPRLGMGGATAVAVGLNLSAAALALWAHRFSPAAAPAPAAHRLAGAKRDEDPAGTQRPVPARANEGGAAPIRGDVRTARGWAAGSGVRRVSLLCLLLVLSSAAALGYEVVWTRILVLVVGSSTYAFSLTAGVYIAGLALGSLWMAPRAERLRAPGEALAHLLIGVGWTALAGLYVIGRLPELFLHGFTWLRGSGGLWALHAALAALVMLPPTFLLGAVFPVAVRLTGGGGGGLGRSVGRVYGWMAVGNVLGVLLAATGLIPWAGLQLSIVVLAVFSLTAAGLALWLRPLARSTRLAALGVAAVGGLVLVGLRPGWDPIVMTSGVYKDAPLFLQLAGSPEGLRRILDAYRLVLYREGVQSVVSVVERPTLSRDRYLALALDGKVDASSGADMSTQVLSGHLPLFVHPQPRRVLVVGLASGVTVGSVAQHPVDAIPVVEIEPAMVEAARVFDDFNGRALSDPRVRLILDDGRRFLSVTRQRFDVIISEPSNPWMSGPARLFTREFFALARARLAPGGVMAQWLPLYGLEPDHLRALVRTFLAEFAHALAFRVSTGDLLLLGSEERLRLVPERFASLFGAEGIRRDLERVGIRSDAELLAAWVAGEGELGRLAGSGRLNSDRNGLIEFGSPRALHENTLPANTELVARLGEESDVFAYLESQGLEARARGMLVSAGLAAVARGDLGRARAWARAAAAAGDSAAGEYLLGKAARAEGRESAAREHWQRALRWGPHAEALVALARTEVVAGDPRGALRLLSEVPGSGRSAEFHYLTALARLALGDAAGALRALARVPEAERDARSLLSAYVRAAAAARLGQHVRAAEEERRFRDGIRALRRSLEREEGQAAMDRLVSDAESLAVVALGRAELGRLQSRIRTALLDPLAAYYQGVSLLWTGHPAGAAEAFEHALRSLDEPDPASMAHFFLALAQLELDRGDAAQVHLRAFLSARDGAQGSSDWAVEEARRLVADRLAVTLAAGTGGGP